MSALGFYLVGTGCIRSIYKLKQDKGQEHDTYRAKLVLHLSCANVRNFEFSLQFIRVRLENEQSHWSTAVVATAFNNWAQEKANWREIR